MVKLSQAEKELNKAARAKARQKRGSLRHNQVSESVLKRYVTAIAMLQAYWRAHEIDALLDDSFDFCMGDYIEHLYAEGEAKGCGTDVLAALQYFIPKVIGKLKYSWKLVGIWKRLEPPTGLLPLLQLLFWVWMGWQHRSNYMICAHYSLWGSTDFCALENCLTCEFSTSNLGHPKQSSLCTIPKQANAKAVQKWCQ